MKAKKQDISVRELFRRKLENATVIPDCTVSTKLMRRLAVREFVRFNPARFNVYYLGGILLTALTVGILIYSASGKSEKKLPPVNIPVTNLTTGNAVTIPAGTTVVKSKPETEGSTKESIKGSLQQKSNPATPKDSGRTTNVKPGHTEVPHVDKSTFVNKGLFPESAADNKTLKKEPASEKVLFEPSVSSGCSPLKIHFYNKLNSSDSCVWTFGDGGFSDQKSPDWIFDVEGEYNVVLQVFDHNSLKASYSSVITVNPRPHALFQITPDKAVIPDDEIQFMNYSTNGVYFRWDFGDGTTSDLFEPKHSYTKYNNYNISLKVTSDFGCSDSLTVLNAFSGSQYFIDFPNAFIPNAGGPTGGFYSSKSDESTQVFHPSYSGVSEYQLKIFSKLGILIFESSDVNIGWDGYFKGQLSNPGVYIWKVRGSFRNGESFIKMGDVTLLGH